jgi:hypothetical protein
MCSVDSADNSLSTEWSLHLMLGAERDGAVQTVSQSNPGQVKVDVSVKVCPKTRKVSELLSCCKLCLQPSMYHQLQCVLSIRFFNLVPVTFHFSPLFLHYHIL